MNPYIPMVSQSELRFVPDPPNQEVLTSFSLITINADEHPVMKSFHRPEDEKRTIVCLQPSLFNAWLDATMEDAKELLHMNHMVELE